jgi:hypothetical protein
MTFLCSTDYSFLTVALSTRREWQYKMMSAVLFVSHLPIHSNLNSNHSQNGFFFKHKRTMAIGHQSSKPFYCIIYFAMTPIHSNIPKKKSVKMNAKGEIIAWDSSSDEGKLLKLLVSTGQTAGKTPKQLVMAFPQQFKKYSMKTFSSAVNNMRKSHEAEVNAARARGSSCKWSSLPVLIAAHPQPASFLIIF